MEKTLDKQIDRYLKKVKKYLVMKPQKKKEYITELRSEIETYVEENEITNIKDIVWHFGEPADCAKRNFSSEELNYIHKRLKIKKIVVCICVISVIICFVFLYAVFAYEFYEVRHSFGVEESFILDDGKWVPVDDYNETSENDVSISSKEYKE